MVIRVENLFIESSSLEPTLLERIRMNLEKIPQMQNEEPEKIYSWWNDLGSDFTKTISIESPFTTTISC